jgi:general secretion pathway protein D
LIVVVGTSCATSRAIHRAQDAVQRGDLDSAVAYYRDALARSPGNTDLRISLVRYSRLAAEAHIKRAKDLEAQNQLSGALAEYRLATELDSTDAASATKVSELERRVQDLAEATRPRPRIEALQQQAAQSSTIPRLDPRAPVRMRYTNASIRDLLTSIQTLTGLNIQFDRGMDAQLNAPYSIDVADTPVEDVLQQILSANTLTYEVQNKNTILVYPDNPQKRQAYEHQYTQTFYISNADPQDIVTILQNAIPQTVAVRPQVTLNKSQNSILVRATAPVLQAIALLIRQNDKPRAEVMIEAEILEVDRTFIKQAGLDLSQYAIGATFSPEVAPPNSSTTAGAFPTQGPPFNSNILSRGTSAADFYLTSPTALIRFLESNQTTRVLAKPQASGRDGQQIQLKLGENVPIPTTTFSAAAAGGIATIPATSVNYQAVGVNLLFTPRVTYQDEIILDNLTLEKSGLGPDLTVGGQTYPTIVSRSITGSIRLRDGESRLIAGLLRDEDSKTQKGLPGTTGVPILRSLLGNSNNTDDSTDLVMLITPHIVRTHELTAEDLQPVYLGTGQNFGVGGAAPLISPDALAATPSAGTAPAGIVSAAPPAAPARNFVPLVQGPPPPDATASRAPGVVPIQPVNPASPAPTAPQQTVRVLLTAPTPVTGGTIPPGSGPHTMPISIAGATQLASLSMTITFDPAVVKAPSVTQGSFTTQTDGAAPTFVPRVDASTGRIDIALSRPSVPAGSSGAGLLAAIMFTAGAAGTTDFTATGIATSVTGQTIPIEFTSARIVVK